MHRLQKVLANREAGLLGLIAMIVMFVGWVDPSFLEATNLRDILVRSAPTAIVACGVMLVVVTGEIDISVGSLFGILASVLGIVLSTDHHALPLAVGIPLVLSVGLACGVLTGVLVTYGRVPSIIVTLGLLSALRGATMLVMRGQNIDDLPGTLAQATKFGFVGLPLALWVAAAVILATALVVHHTPLGRRIYAIGSSPESARLLGLSAHQLKILVFAITGLLTALAVIVDVPRLPKIEAGIGVGFELLVVTCVVVGGVSIRGGTGSVFGVVLAVILMTLVRPVLTFLDVGEAGEKWTKAIQGLFIILAIVVDRLSPSRGGASSMKGNSQRARFGWWHESILAILLVAVVGLGAATVPGFAQPRSQLFLSKHLWEIALLALPMTLIIITAGIDLSIGSIMGLCAITFGICFQSTHSLALASLACVVVGTVGGLTNGLLITRLRVHPLIITLATYAAFRGLAEGISQGVSYSQFGTAFGKLARGTFLQLPYPGWCFLLMTVATGVMLSRSHWGRYLYALGHNEQAATFAGVPTQSLKAFLYTLAGCQAGLVTLVYVSRFDTAKADAGTAIELDVITAVVLGGTSIFGGRGNVVGTTLGLLLIHETKLFVGRYWQIEELKSITVGVLLIASILLYRALTPRTEE